MSVSETHRDDGAVLIFATRYALGRRSYAPALVKSALVRHQKSISIRDADTLLRDIEAHDSASEETWQDVLGWLREMRERGLFAEVVA